MIQALGQFLEPEHRARLANILKHLPRTTGGDARRAEEEAKRAERSTKRENDKKAGVFRAPTLDLFECVLKFLQCDRSKEIDLLCADNGIGLMMYSRTVLRTKFIHQIELDCRGDAYIRGTSEPSTISIGEIKETAGGKPQLGERASVLKKAFSDVYGHENVHLMLYRIRYKKDTRSLPVAKDVIDEFY